MDKINYIEDHHESDDFWYGYSDLLKDGGRMGKNADNLFNERGNRHGYWEEYNSYDILCRRGYFDNGNPDGFYEAYFDNGKIKYRGYFNKGELIGHFICFFYNSNYDFFAI